MFIKGSLNNLRDFRNKIAERLGKIAELLRSPKVELENQSNFLDLAPTDTADEAGIYSNALFAAMDNPRVYNIALTGPYGSGKSSIIKSFLKKYHKKPLQISLAAFLPDSELRIADVEPERSESTPRKFETKAERKRAGHKTGD